MTKAHHVMMLPFILTDGKLAEDDLGIRESGNGMPDLIDEARNEVDFFLSLRGKMALLAYLYGIR